MAKKYICSLVLIGAVALLLTIATDGVAKTVDEKPLEALALYTMATGEDQKINNICELLDIPNNGNTDLHAKSHKILEDDEKPMNVRGIIVFPLESKELFEIIFAYRKSSMDQKLGEIINGFYLLTDETGKLKNVYHRIIWWTNDEMKQSNFQSIDNGIRDVFKQEALFWLKWYDGKDP